MKTDNPFESLIGRKVRVQLDEKHKKIKRIKVEPDEKIVSDIVADFKIPQHDVYEYMYAQSLTPTQMYKELASRRLRWEERKES